MIPRGALEVILFADRKFVGSLVFSEPTVTVGSDPSSMIHLDDPAVSPEHALLHFTGRTAIIEDHGGTSGVFVGGRQVDHHLIQAGDEIRIGRHGLRFVVHQVAQPAPPLPVIPPAAPATASPAAAPHAAAPAHSSTTSTPAPLTLPAPTHIYSQGPATAQAPAIAQAPAPALATAPAVIQAPAPVALPVQPAPAPVALPVEPEPEPAPERVARRVDVFPSTSQPPVTAMQPAPLPPTRPPVVATPVTAAPPSRPPAPSTPPTPAGRQPLFDPLPELPGEPTRPSAAPPAALREATPAPSRAPAAPPASVKAPPAPSKAPPAPAPAPPASKAPIAPPASKAPTAPATAPSAAKSTARAAAPPVAERPAPSRAPAAPQPTARATQPPTSRPPAAAPSAPAPRGGSVAPVQPPGAQKQQLPDLARGAAPELSVDIGLADLLEPAGGAALPAPAPGRHHDDDDDDEDFVPAFSLLDAMRDREVAGGRPQRAEDAVVQIVYCHDDFIVGLGHLTPRRRLRLDGGTALDFARPGLLNLRLAPGATAELHRPGEPTPRYLIDSSGGDATVDIDLLSRAVVRLRDRDSVLLQFVAASSVPRGSLAPEGPSRESLFVAAASAVAHVVAFVVLGMSPASSTAAAEITQGRFAMIEMKDPILEVPKEKPKAKEKVRVKEKVKAKQEVKAPPTPVPPTPQPPMPQLPESLRKFVSRAPRGTPGPVNPKVSSTANKALAALGTLGGTSSTAMAVTNLDAVPSTGSGGGGFQVSGAIGKMDGGLHLAPGGSGVGRVETKGGAHFGILAGKVNGKIGGDVRGRVKQAPAREVEVQGELPREAIAKVINAHIHEIQGCWERRMLANHGLAGGKLALDWVIVPTGSVGMVRIKSSDIKDSQLSTCVQAAIRLWKFPAPKGGSVTITYPFVFQTM